MAFVFHRRLAMPVWAVAFFTVAFTAPPAATLFLMPGAIPWWRMSRAPVRVLPTGHVDQPSAAITRTAGTGVCTLDEPHRGTADDALDLVRMDDDGGWQMPRPPA